MNNALFATRDWQLSIKTVSYSDDLLLPFIEGELSKLRGEQLISSTGV